MSSCSCHLPPPSLPPPPVSPERRAPRRTGSCPADRRFRRAPVDGRRETVAPSAFSPANVSLRAAQDCLSQGKTEDRLSNLLNICKIHRDVSQRRPGRERERRPLANSSSQETDEERYGNETGGGQRGETGGVGGGVY